MKKAAAALLVLAAMLLSACQTIGPDGQLTALSTVQRDDPSKKKTAAPVNRTTVSIASGQSADIYTPGPAGGGSTFAYAASASKAPVVLYVHGGGWTKGSREKVYSLPGWAKSRGYVLVSVDYRPLPRTTIEGQVAEVQRAIQWTKFNIASHGGDPNRIVIMGHSSGSHLVAMVAVRKLGGGVKGVIANDVQAYDLEHYYRLRDNSMDPVYVRAFGHNPANWRKWSPITYARNGAGYPPFLILYSGSNYERRKALANSFGSVLRSKGTRVSLFDGLGYTHGSIASSVGKNNAVTKSIDAFLKTVF